MLTHDFTEGWRMPRHQARDRAPIAWSWFVVGLFVAALAFGAVGIAMGTRFELWDKLRHEAHEASVLAAGLPDALRDMVL